MMAIGNHVTQAYPWLKVKYCPSEIFQSDLIEAMKDKNLSYFRTRYRSVDVFLLDDVQFISKNADFTQEEIFHTFNYFYQNKKQIVISADRPPQALPQLHDRLQSRFQQGLIVDVKSPNFETRMAILKTKAQESEIPIGPDVLKYLATRFTSQVRPMEAALSILHFTAQHEKRPIDLQLAKMSLKALPQENGIHQVTIEDILRVVSRTLHVDETLILSSNRTEQVALAPPRLYASRQEHDSGGDTQFYCGCIRQARPYNGAPCRSKGERTHRYRPRAADADRRDDRRAEILGLA